MDWWQTLIVAVVPVLLTLIITNVAENRRRKQDWAQRDQDRTAARQAQADARRASIEDHWRNERLQRMTALVDLANDLVVMTRRLNDEMRRAEQMSRSGQPGEALHSAATTAVALKKKIDVELFSAVTSVALIASQEFYVELRSILERVWHDVRPAMTEEAISELATADPQGVERYRLGTSAMADSMADIFTRIVESARHELTESDKTSLPFEVRNQNDVVVPRGL